MFTIQKTMEISGSHSLKLNYASKCQRRHGHNWIITVECQRQDLDENEMVIDFSKIKKAVMGLDHQDLDELLDFNPTAERIAKFICDMIEYCVKVTVQESQGNIAIYEKDDS